MKRIFAVLLCAVAIFMISACTKADSDTKQAVTTTSITDEMVEIGQGSHKFNFTVTHLDGTKKKYLVSTDEETVGEALYQLKIIDGNKEQYGLYVKTVDGEILDYNADGAFWSLYVDGNVAAQGVDFIKLTDGKNFEFRACAA